METSTVSWLASVHVFVSGDPAHLPQVNLSMSLSMHLEVCPKFWYVIQHVFNFFFNERSHIEKFISNIDLFWNVTGKSKVTHQFLFTHSRPVWSYILLPLRFGPSYSL